MERWDCLRFVYFFSWRGVYREHVPKKALFLDAQDPGAQSSLGPILLLFYQNFSEKGQMLFFNPDFITEFNLNAIETFS